MKRRVKRRVFLMSMALATGAGVPVLAKAGGKGAGSEHGEMHPIVSDHLPRMLDSPVAAEPASLYVHLRHLFAAAETGLRGQAGRGWRLEMLPAQMRDASASEHGPEQKAKRFGLALRLAF